MLAATTQSIAKSPLSKLHAELRLQIYAYVVFSSAGEGNCINEGLCVIVRNGDHGTIPEPALLSTCKLVRKEAIGLFYSENQFTIVVDNYHSALLVLKIQKEAALRSQYDCSINWSTHRRAELGPKTLDFRRRRGGCNARCTTMRAVWQVGEFLE